MVVVDVSVPKCIKSTECDVNAGMVLISLSYTLTPYLNKPLAFVMHGQYDARPVVTFPVMGHLPRESYFTKLHPW